MRRAYALIPALLIIAGCNSNDPWESLDVVPGDVTLDPAKGLTGHWRIIEGGLISRGVGGACMVVNLKELQQGMPPPTSQADCETRAINLFGGKAYGYYLANEGPQGQCWIKPEAGTCIRSNDAIPRRMPTRWDKGDHVTNAQPFPMRNPTTGVPFPAYTQWRVQACLFEQGKTQLTCKWGRAIGFRRPDIVNPNP